MLLPLLALISGILASAYLDSRAVWLCLPLAAAISFLKRPVALLAVFLLGSALGSLPHPVPPLPPGPEASRVIATLQRAPDWRGIGVYLDVAIESLDGVPLAGRARLTEFLDEPEPIALFNALELHSGDRVEIVVRLRRPARYRDPGVFDFRDYLERQGIFWTGTIRSPRLITVLQRGSRLRKLNDALQTGIEERLARFFPDDRDTRGLVLGMVLGRKHDLTARVERDFQAGGLYHMVVVSGFNLAVIAGAAAAIGRFTLRRRGARLALIGVSVFAYAAIVGVQPPVVRATLMVFALISSRLLDRDYSPLNAIALTAFLLLVLEPRALQDSSFQMTFAAVAAVAGIGMPAARWLSNNLTEKLRDFSNAERDGFLTPDVADWRVARRMFCERHGLPHAVVTIPARAYQLLLEGIVVSVAVEMIFAVFMVETFHRISPLSPLINVPAGVIAAIVTPLGLALVALPLAVGKPVAWLVTKLIHLLLAFPFWSVRVPSAPVWLWVVYAAVVALAVFSVWKRRRGLCAAGVLGVVVLQVVAVCVDFSPAPPRSTTVTFLDVGQGDSSLIELPDGRRVLVDGGGVAAGRFLGLQDESTFSIGENVVSAYLFSRRIRRLDAVVLTHAHNDHIDGLFEVLENFRVGELWVGRNPPVPAYRALLAVAARRGVAVRRVWAGQQIREFTVLHPPEKWRVRKSAENNDSVVLLLRAGRKTALFTGDLELPLPGVTFVNVLKVAHHGSKGVRMKVKSEVRVISVGASNPFGHPHPSSLPAWRTDLLGAIEVRLE